MGGVNQKESREDIILNIYRDTGEGNFLNRVCKDKSTGSIQYYCFVDKHLNITVYKGDYSGPIIATAIQCRDPRGVTKVKMPQSALLLKHGHGVFSGNTLFEIDGKRVHWKGHSELVEDDTGVRLAVYKSKGFESSDRRLGRLLVTARGEPYIDAIVSSALVRQARTDEYEFEKLELAPQNASRVYYTP